MLDVHENMFIWICQLHVYYLSVCVSVYCVPGIKFRSLALVTIALTQRAISPNLNVTAVINNLKVFTYISIFISICHIKTSLEMHLYEATSMYFFLKKLEAKFLTLQLCLILPIYMSSLSVRSLIVFLSTQQLLSYQNGC